MINKEDNLIKASMDEGNDVFFDILENYPVLDKDDCRRSAVLFAVMTSCIGYLHLEGWSEQQLVNEVFDHCELARTMFGPDDKME
jgi:hypothetical protein